MGVSTNLEVFLSEKPKDHREFNTMDETKVHDQEQSRHHDDDGDDLSEAKQQTVGVQENKENNDDECNVPVIAMIPSGLKKIKIPQNNVEEELTEEDGFKTPKGPEHRIPPMLVCPPAPRKPKTSPSSSPSYTAKRKVSSFRSSRWVVIDFSQAIVDPLLPTTPSVVDRGATWSKKVKVKHFSDDDDEDEEPSEN